MIWQCGSRCFDLTKGPLMMGILNVTPDSFSDGYPQESLAKQQADALIADGAQIIDIGGESTRPGSDPVSAELEWQRIEPLIHYLRDHHNVAISIDTQKAAVAEAAIHAGAHIINHVSASLDYPSMIPVLAKSSVGYVAMHMLDRPKVMQEKLDYGDAISEIVDGLAPVRAALAAHQISSDRVLFDPGIGFGKSLAHNFQIFKNVSVLQERLARPLLMGLSRKSWMSHLFEKPLEDMNERDAYTLIASLLLSKSAIAVHRVHNVAWLRNGLLIQERFLAQDC